MAITEKVLDELMKEYRDPEDLLGENGIFKNLQKALIERILKAPII